MLLDFENLSSSQKLEVDEISTELKREFEDLIKTIGDKNKYNKDLFFSNIISRNNDENQLFYSLCLIELSQRLYSENKIKKIIIINEYISIIESFGGNPNFANGILESISNKKL